MRIPAIRRPLAFIVGLALLFTLSGAVSAPPVHASDPLSVTVSCDSGLNQFYCWTAVTGGAPGYTYAWQMVSGSGTITSNPTYSYVDGNCSGTSPSIKVTVQDSVGTTVIKTKTFVCRSGPWQ